MQPPGRGDDVLRGMAELPETFMEPLDSNVTADEAGTPPPSTARVPAHKTAGGERTGVARRPPPEAATLVFAVTVAVAFGVASGLWINARLASAASGVQPAPARLLPDVGADRQKAAAHTAPTEPGAVVDGETPPAPDEAAPTHASPEPVAAEAIGSKSAGAADESRAGRRDTRDTAAAGAVAGEADAPDRTAGRSGAASSSGSKGSAVSRGRVAPCALYASAGALTVRSGGAATLVLGGPGEGGRINVTTPDWSDIAVLSEGRAGGGKGWLKYSVRSVSKRAGVYTVRLTTPCGSQTIPVTVTRQ